MDRAIVCYGAGGAYHWVEEVLERRLGYTVVGILDARFETLQNQFNCPVWSNTVNYKSIKCSLLEHSSPTLLVALGNKDSCKSVVERLSELGWIDVCSLNNFFPIHLGFQVEDLEYADFEEIMKRSSLQIEIARNLLSDNLSKSIFDQITNMFYNKKGHWLTSHCYSEMQLSPEFHDAIDFSHIIRCGVDSAEISNLLGQDRVQI